MEKNNLFCGPNIPRSIDPNWGEDWTTSNSEEMFPTVEGLPKSLEKDIIISCYATISELFAMMHNPKYRGPNFTWENFPEMTKSLCEAKIHISVVYKSKYKNEVEKFAGKCALDIANVLVRWLK